MEELKFIRDGEREDGTPLYKLIVDGKLVRSGMTTEEAMEEISRAEDNLTRPV